MCKKYTEKFEMDRRETRWWSRRALSYPLLMSTPKSEPKAEQPSIKKAESTKKKDILHAKTQRRNRNKTVGGAHLQYNQIPYYLDG